MPVVQPYFRTCRQFTDGHYAHAGKGTYVRDGRLASDGEHYVRALSLIQKDLLEIFDFIEPDNENSNCYSYRIHALHMRAAIEVGDNHIWQRRAFGRRVLVQRVRIAAQVPGVRPHRCAGPLRLRSTLWKDALDRTAAFFVLDLKLT